MTSMILFGLALSPLYKAIAQVESDRGATSANVYQIRNIYVEDVNRIYDLKRGMEYHARDVYDRDKSEMMMYLYWKHYAYQYAKQTRSHINYCILARLHNGGPNGMLKSATWNYWLRVRNELIKMGIDPDGKTEEKVR